MIDHRDGSSDEGYWPYKVEPWADKYGQDFFDWYASASIDDRKRYQTALLSWDMPGKEATIGWCRQFDRKHTGDLGVLPETMSEQQRDRIWSLHERVVRAWLDVTYYEENEPDGLAAATAERDQAKRELRQALGFVDEEWDQLWSLVEVYKHAYHESKNLIGSEGDYIRRDQALHQARRELRQALGFTVD